MGMYDARRPQSILVGTLAAEDLSSTGVFGYTEKLLEGCTVSRLNLIVTTVISSSAPAVVTFYARPTAGSSSGQLTLGTVSLPDAAAANSVYYKNISPVDVPAGYQLAYDVTTAATSSGAALAGVLAQYTPEEPANESLFIASA